jgi:hypothetical protein
MKVYVENVHAMFGVLWDSEPGYRCLRLGLWRWDVLFEWKSPAREKVDLIITEAAEGLDDDFPDHGEDDDRAAAMGLPSRAAGTFRDDDYTPEAMDRTTA